MKKWSIYIITLLLLSACTNEAIIPDGRNPQDGNEDLTLILKFPKSSSLETKALTAELENKVQTLDILVFKKSSNSTAEALLEDEFAYSVKFTGSAIGSSTSTVDGDTKTVQMKIKSMQTEQRIIVLANLPSNTFATTDTVAGAKLSTLINKLTYTGANYMKDGLSFSSGDIGFPMWGQMPSHIQFYHSNSSAPSTVTINMIRSVARIDIGVDLNGVGDPALGFGKIFKIHNVYLCKPNTGGYIYPFTPYVNRTDSANMEKVFLPNPYNHTSKTDYIKYTYAENDTRSMARTIYVTESDTLDSPSGNTPAFLVVEADYYDATRFYRIDFTRDGKYIPLLRNHQYTINIVGARTDGFTSLNDALASHPSKTGNSVILGDADQDINDIITNEKYMLGVSTSDIKVGLEMMAKPLELKIKTDYPGGWSATVESTSNWLRISESSTSAAGKKTIELSSGNYNSGIHKGSSRTGKIIITAGTLKKEVYVRQEVPNVYMVNPFSSTNNILAISPSTLGENGERKVNTTSSTNQPSDHELYVIWTNIASLTFSDKGGTSSGGVPIMWSTVSASGPGLAIVGIRQIPDRHAIAVPVWIVDNNSDPTLKANQRYNGGMIFMDRNLGATSSTHSGWYFQWGRPFPFDNPISSPIPYIAPWDIDESTGDLQTMLDNKFTFYTTTGSPYDWMGSQNNNMWNTPDGQKSAFDPCPPGWRVPLVVNDQVFANSSWNGFSQPTSTSIDGISGETSPQNQGYVWGSSARGTNAVMYNFSGSVSSSFRANGLPVRCVKDITIP